MTYRHIEAYDICDAIICVHICGSDFSNNITLNIVNEFVKPTKL